MTTGVEQDVLDLLLDQHNRLRSLLWRLSDGPGARRRELFETLVGLLAAHEVAEEVVVHPTAQRAIADGAELVEARKQEEERARRDLAELYELGVDHPDFDARMAEFATAMVEHASREELEEFPYLRQSAAPEQLRRMADAVRVAEAAAPTRAGTHGGAAAHGALIAEPPIAVFDRVRDAVRRWRDSPEGWT
ncbi:hemerythrin domain-containing protein [Micromonospora sp. NPDC049559]|uniref:hemerythrin domain-containing protein n=1 Tax=Micromonospora sp. NPDC049559 TaxID=3155923 RepID=UPI0034363AFF